MKKNAKFSIGARIRSFGYAFEGLRYLIQHEHNAWIHAFLTVAVLIVGTWLGISRIEWALLVAAMGLVWMGELVNTAVEAIVNMVSPEKHPLAKAAKDTAAGAVLVSAIAALVIGLLVLGPPLWARLFG